MKCQSDFRTSTLVKYRNPSFLHTRYRLNSRVRLNSLASAGNHSRIKTILNLKALKHIKNDYAWGVDRMSVKQKPDRFQQLWINP